MISKRPFRYQFFPRVNIAFNNNICIRRHFKVLGKAFHQFNFSFPKKSGQHIFVHIIRQWSSCCISINRVSTQCNGNRHFSFCFLILPVMPGTNLMFMPVHACCPVIKYLHSVHADISNSCNRIFGMHKRKCYKPSSITWPAL